MHRVRASAPSVPIRLTLLFVLLAVFALVTGAAPRPAHAQDLAKTPDGVVPPEYQMSAMGRLASMAASGQLQRAVARARAKAMGLSAPTDTVGGDVSDDDGPAGGQAELTIAVDATGQHIVVGCNDTRGFSLNPVSVSGFAYSDDGGLTFVDGGQLPVNTGTGTIGTTILPQVFGDPEVKYLGGSTFVYFSIMVKKFSATQAAQTMCFHRSTDYGHTWTGPFEVPSATNPHGLLTGAGAPRDAADKEYADVDPETGRVMMTWNNFTPVAPGQEMSSTFCDNIMDAVPVWSARQIVSAVSGDQNAIIPRFAGGGSNDVYAAWPRSVSGGRSIRFARSTDNGATWFPTANVSGGFGTIDQILGNDRVHQFPGLAVDKSGGAHQGTIYLVYANNSNHDGSDIAFQRSTDGGLTFSTPVLLNSRPGADRAQWYPWVTVDANTGRVHVFYYDQGIAVNGDLSETTHLFSDDGGLTWSKPTPLTDRPFHAGYGNDTGQPNLGDYDQAVAQGGELFAVWAGAPNLVPFTDGQPGSASMTVPDIYFKRVTDRTASVRLGPVSFVDGNGNGFIDVGESVSLTLPLENYVTNVLSASAISGISATLSSSTPGVTVTQAFSAYPGLAPGASAPNATPYVIVLSPSFVPGTHIDLALNVTSSENPTTLLYTLAPRTPDVPTTLLSENFDGVAPGTLPAGWATSHGGGDNTVPWTTNNTFAGTASNAAFHVNANDGPATANGPTRFERLFTPSFTVPANADYVTVDMDIAYDTEDDPAFNIQAFDGFCLRVTDLTTGRVLRSVLAEAFAEEFTTDGFNHYPKHLPRGAAGGRYFEDMSVWGGFSNGFQHVHMKLPGMAGSAAQLRFEYTQDVCCTCADVRPGHQCGVLFDNLVIKSFKSAALVQTAVAVDPASGQCADAITLHATVSPAVALEGAISGTVQFSVNGSDVGAPVAVASDGSASVPYTIALGHGSYPIGARFTSSNPAFLDSQGSNVLTVNPTPPTITVSVSPKELWPPNRMLVPVHATVTVSDRCDPNPTFVLKSITLTCDIDHNEVHEDANRPDVVGADLNTPDLDFQLRAEKSVLGCDLTYTIVYVAVNASGDMAQATATVRVPHDQRGNASVAAHGAGPAAGSDGLALVIPSAVRATQSDGGDDPENRQLNGAGNPPLFVFDARKVNQGLIYLGNSAGVFTPASAVERDVDGDGFDDLIMNYSADQLASLLALPVTSDDPIVLYYRVRSGTGYETAISLLGGTTAAPGRLGTPGGSDAFVPRTTSLAPGYPNPTRDRISFTLDLSSDRDARLEVYDLRGARVRTLMDGSQAAGRYIVTWDGTDNGGRRVANGVYLVRVDAGAYHAIHKAVFLK